MHWIEPPVCSIIFLNGTLVDSLPRLRGMKGVLVMDATYVRLYLAEAGEQDYAVLQHGVYCVRL